MDGMKIKALMKRLQVRRGHYMTFDLGLPNKTQAAVQIHYGVSHNPFSREEAEQMAKYIQNLPNIMSALEAVNCAFEGDDYDLESLLEKLDKALITETQNT